MYILHFRRIFIPTPRRVIENPKELGALILWPAKILKENN